MNRSRLDMNTARDSTPTMAVTRRAFGAAPGWAAGIGGLAVTGPPSKSEIWTHHTSASPSASRNPTDEVHSEYGCWTRRAAPMLYSSDPRHRRGEVGAARRAGGLPRQPQVRRDGQAHRSAT